MAFIRNPTFKSYWGHGKTPELQIKIIKQIIISGQLSKKKVTSLLDSNNYPDVSDALDALLSKGFIKFSEKVWASGRNPEKFYKITEKGLRAILTVKLLPDEFWKAIMLFCISSKKPVNEVEFLEYYHKFEYDFLGNLDIQGHFFLVPLFDSILDQWLQDHNELPSISLSQKVMESLAINGPSTMKKLIEKTNTTEDDIIKVLDTYLVRSNNNNSSQKSSYTSTNTSDKSNVTDNIANRKSFFYDLISHTLIIANENPSKGITYELSLFGIMLVVAIINYHFTGMDTYRNPHNDISIDNVDSIIRPDLFYNKINLATYYDTIVRRYKNKLPLVFGRWDFLKSVSDTMLYDGFDFLAYKSSRPYTIESSIWSFGSKEFYDDIKDLTFNAMNKLQIIYPSGNYILSEYRKCQPWIQNDPRIRPVYKKLGEIREIVEYAGIVFILQELKSGNPIPDGVNDRKSYTINDIKNIEKVFSDEISFLFYLSLCTNFLPESYKRKYPLPKIKDTEHGIILIRSTDYKEESRKLHKLGGPRERLITILARDKEIRQWFSGWIGGIIEYRRKILDKMSEFHDKVNNADESIKKDNIQTSIGKKAKITSDPEEYNISKICSDFNSVYDYSFY